MGKKSHKRRREKFSPSREEEVIVKVIKIAELILLAGE